MIIDSDHFFLFLLSLWTLLMGLNYDILRCTFSVKARTLIHGGDKTDEQ